MRAILLSLAIFFSAANISLAADNSFAFNLEAKTVTFTTPEKSTRVWDLVTGRELRIVWNKASRTNPITFSPGKKRAVIIGDDKVAAIWDTTTGKQLFTLSPNALSASFSSDGRQVVIGCSNKIAQSWNVVTGKLMQQFTGHNGAVTGVALSADAKILGTACDDHTFRQWDAVTGKSLSEFSDDKGEILSISISPDGKYIVCGNKDGFTRVWNTTDATSRDFSVPEHMMSPVVQVAFDGKDLFMRNDRNIAFSWDYATAKENRRIDGGVVPITQMAVAGNGEVIATCAGRFAVTWDTATGKQLKRFSGHTDAITDLAISADASVLVTGSNDTTGWVWNAKEGGEIKRLQGTMKGITSVAISPDKKWVVTGGVDGKSYQWDAATGRPERELAAPGVRKVGAVAFAPGGKEAIIADGGGLNVWDITNRKIIRPLGDVRIVKSINMSSDLTQLVACDDRSAYLIAVDKGTTIQTYSPRGGSAMCGAVSKDKSKVAVGCSSGEVVLFTAAGKELGVMFGHSGAIKSIHFTPDGKFVLSGGFDGTTRIWDVATMKELCALVTFSSTTWVAFDPAGHYDSSNFGDIDELFAVYNVPAAELRTIKDRFFEDGLLAKYLGHKKDEGTKPATTSAPTSAPSTAPATARPSAPATAPASAPATRP